MIDKIQKKNRDFYNSKYMDWVNNKNNSFFHEKQFRLFKKLISKNAKVLDVGCAWGIHLPLFLGIGEGIKYEGIDISKRMISVAKNRWPHNKFLIGDILDKETLPNKKYDALWCAAILMHIPIDQWPNLFLNIRGLLNNKGYVYFTIPAEKLHDWVKNDPRHFSLMYKKDVYKFLKINNWKLIQSGSLKGGNYKWNWFIAQKIN